MKNDKCTLAQYDVVLEPTTYRVVVNSNSSQTS